MQALHMITVFKEGGQPHRLAGTGLSTLRKFAGKYTGLQLGDIVVMNHTTDPTTRGPVPLTEVLRVSSYAIGTLDTLVAAHGARNHDGTVFEEDLEAHMLSLYPLPEGEERNPDELFIAIYF